MPSTSTFVGWATQESAVASTDRKRNPTRSQGPLWASGGMGLQARFALSQQPRRLEATSSGARGAGHLPTAVLRQPTPETALTPEPSPFTAPTSLHGPRPPHNSGTSQELRRRREEQLAAAQALTTHITSCSSVFQVVDLYDAHGDQFNAIHFSALFVSLARMATGPAAAPRARAPPRSLTPGERYLLHDILTQRLVPHVGLRLLGFSARDLTTVLACLARLDYPPPAFWMAEWMQHFSRRLPPSAPHRAREPSLVTQSAWDLDPYQLGELSLATSPFNQQTAVDAVPHGHAGNSGSFPHVAAPGDLSQAMWALARLRRRRPSVTQRRPASASGGGPGAAVGPATGLEATTGGSGAGAFYSERGGALDSGVVPAGGDVPAPSALWLQAVAGAFADQAADASGVDVATYLCAAAHLRYRPPTWVLETVLRRCEQLACGHPQAPGASLSGHGMHMRYSPGGPRQGAASGGSGGAGGCCVEGRSGRSSFGGRGRMTSSELASVLWALAVLGFRPEPDWLHRITEELTRRAGVAGAGALVASLPRHPGGQGLAAVEHPPKDTGPSRRDTSACEAGAAPPALQGASGVAAGATIAVPAAQGGAPCGSAPDGNGGDWWRDFLERGDEVITAAPMNLSAAAFASAIAVATLRSSTPPLLSPLELREVATCLWALSRMSYRPDPAVLRTLVGHACALVPEGSNANRCSDGAVLNLPAAGGGGTDSLSASTIETSSITTSAGVVRDFGPSAALLHRATPQDLSMLLHSLGVLAFQPEPVQVLALLVAMAANLQTASRQDLVVWLTALARLRLAVPGPWVVAYLRRVSLDLEALPSLALVNWVDALTRVQATGVRGFWKAVEDGRRPAQPGRGGAGRGAVARSGRALPSDAAARYAVGGRSEGARTVLTVSSRAAGHGPVLPSVARGPQQQGAEVPLRISDVSDPWVVLPLPFPNVPEPSWDGQPARLGTAGHGLPPGTMEASPPPRLRRLHPRAPATTAVGTRLGNSSRPGGSGSGFVLRPAADLMTPDLRRRVQKLVITRLPHLQLEHQCRLAWALARLQPEAGREGLVDALVRHTTASLQRRLDDRYEQLNGAPCQPGSALPRHFAGRADAAVVADLTGEAPAVVTGGSGGQGRATAVWLVRLVWALAVLLRRAPPLQSEVRLRQLPPRHLRAAARSALQQHCAHDPAAQHRRRLGNFATPAPATRPAAPAGSAKDATLPVVGELGDLEPSKHASRLWYATLLEVLMPQLPLLSNAQLLQLVHGVAALRARKRPQAHLAAGIRRYCRRRVAATCGQEDSCDLTTAGLLHWTRDWSPEGEKVAPRVPRWAQLSRIQP